MATTAGGGGLTAMVRLLVVWGSPSENFRFPCVPIFTGDEILKTKI